MMCTPQRIVQPYSIIETPMIIKIHKKMRIIDWKIELIRYLKVNSLSAEEKNVLLCLEKQWTSFNFGPTRTKVFIYFVWTDSCSVGASFFVWIRALNAKMTRVSTLHEELCCGWCPNSGNSSSFSVNSDANEIIRLQSTKNTFYKDFCVNTQKMNNSNINHCRDYREIWSSSLG